VTRDDIPFAIWSELRPDTPYQCVRAQCGFLFSSASSPTRSLTVNGRQKHDGAVERGEREIGQKSWLTRLAEE
ncbi:hypothetical protein ACSLPB_29155, partial [Escherichia coli]